MPKDYTPLFLFLVVGITLDTIQLKFFNQIFSFKYLILVLAIVIGFLIYSKHKEKENNKLEFQTTYYNRIRYSKERLNKNKTKTKPNKLKTNNWK